MRVVGPAMDRTASNSPCGPRIGALTEPTPGWRSPALEAHPFRRAKFSCRSKVSPVGVFSVTAVARSTSSALAAGGAQAMKIFPAEPAVTGSSVPISTIARSSLEDCTTSMHTRPPIERTHS